MIRPKYRDDKGLHAHEETHFYQWLSISAAGPLVTAMCYYLSIHFHLSVTLLVPALIHGLLYKLSDSYKLLSELKAYKEQLRHYPDDRSELFAEFISTKYDLSITKDQALALLKEK